MLFFYNSSLFPSLYHIRLLQYVSLPIFLSLLLPSSLLSRLLSSSPGCVWWTDVIISTSFIPQSSKEGVDCIYQALVCLREALGTVVLHSSLSEARREKPCVHLTEKQINRGNNHIPLFIICVLYTVHRSPALSEVNQAIYCMWLQ